MWISIGIVTVVFVLIVLALAFVRVVYVEESTAVAIMRSGAFNRMVFSKKGYYLADKDGQVESDGGPVTVCEGELVAWKNYKYKFLGSESLGKLLGGMRFYIWKLEYVHTYTWDWLKSMPDGEIKPKHEDDEYCIYTGFDYPYGLIMGDGIITSDNLPVDVRVVLTAHITNPYKALFATEWFVLFIAGVKPYIKDYINSHSYDEIRVDAARTKRANEIFLELEARKINSRSIIEILRADYGIKLVRVEFSKVNLSESNQTMVLEEKKARADAARDKTKRLGSTTAPFMDMLYTELGVDFVGEHSADEKVAEQIKLANRRRISEIRAAYDADPAEFEKKYAGAIERSKAWINRQIDSDAGALKSYHFEGGSPAMELIALLGDALRGSGSVGSLGSTGGASSAPGSADPAGNKAKKKRAWDAK